MRLRRIGPHDGPGRFNARLRIWAPVDEHAEFGVAIPGIAWIVDIAPAASEERGQTDAGGSSFHPGASGSLHLNAEHATFICNRLPIVNPKPRIDQNHE